MEFNKAERDYLLLCRLGVSLNELEDAIEGCGVLDRIREEAKQGDDGAEVASRNGDVAFLDGIVYVYYERPLDRNPWVPVNRGGRGPALTDSEMKEAQLLVRDDEIVNQHVLACTDAWKQDQLCIHEKEFNEPHYHTSAKCYGDCIKEREKEVQDGAVPTSRSSPPGAP